MDPGAWHPVGAPKGHERALRAIHWPQPERKAPPLAGPFLPAGSTTPIIINAIDNHSHLRLNYRMYVCICNAITDKQIRKAAESGVEDLWSLQRELGVAAGCGSCKEMASEILSESRQTRPQFEPVRYEPVAG